MDSRLVPRRRMCLGDKGADTKEVVVSMKDRKWIK